MRYSDSRLLLFLGCSVSANTMSEDKNQQSSKESQQFDDAASKLFKVPIQEIGELEEKKKQSKQALGNTESESKS